MALVPTAPVLQSGRQVSNAGGGTADISLGRWYCHGNHFMGTLYFSKIIAIRPEVCRPSDTFAGKHSGG